MITPVALAVTENKGVEEKRTKEGTQREEENEPELSYQPAIYQSYKHSFVQLNEELSRIQREQEMEGEKQSIRERRQEKAPDAGEEPSSEIEVQGEQQESPWNPEMGQEDWIQQQKHKWTLGSPQHHLEKGVSPLQRGNNLCLIKAGHLVSPCSLDQMTTEQLD